jgi:hypothetical protein
LLSFWSGTCPAEVAAGRVLAGWWADADRLGLVMLTGVLGMGGATVLCWCSTVNALADHSPPELRPVRIHELAVTTHHGVFRKYMIECQLLGHPRNRTLLSTPDEMRPLDLDLGIAEVHAGWLGWPWVRTIHPIRPDRDPAPEKPGEV